MALPMSVQKLGEFRGADGRPGTFEDATAVHVAADEADIKPVVYGPNGEFVEFKIPRGLPGANAIPTAEAVGTYLGASDSPSRPGLEAGMAQVASDSASAFTSQVRATADERVLADKHRFDITQARAQFGVRFDPTTAYRQQQHQAIVRELGGEIFMTQSLGLVGSSESYMVSRFTPTGKLIGSMSFTDCGHGSCLMVEVDAGTVYLWLEATDVINHASGAPGRYNIIRVPWSTGQTFTLAQALVHKVSAVSNGTVWRSLEYDSGSGLVFSMENMSSTVRRCRTYTLAQVKAATLGAPITDVLVDTAGMFMQGMTYLSGKIYGLTGTPSTQMPYYPATIVQWDANVKGGPEFVKNIEHAREGSPAETKVLTEPEGISVARGVDGSPILVVGMSQGQYMVSNAIWFLSMDALPYSSARPEKVSDTGWRTEAFTMSAGAAASDVDGTRFALRVRDGYLEMRGQVLKTLVTGQNDIGLLATAWRPAKAFSVPVTKQMTTASPRGIVRLDIAASGYVRVFLEAGDAGGSNMWVSLDNVRYPLPTAADPLKP